VFGTRGVAVESVRPLYRWRRSTSGCCAARGSRLEFRIRMIPYEGDDAWVEETLGAILATLRAPQPPAPSDECEYCAYVARASAP